MPMACHNSYTLKTLMELLKYFSNSLIIHEDKTKEISTVKEVWICDRFGYVKWVKKNSAAPRFFNPLLSVWISDETLFLVFDILPDHCSCKSCLLLLLLQHQTYPSCEKESRLVTYN